MRAFSRPVNLSVSSFKTPMGTVNESCCNSPWQPRVDLAGTKKGGFFVGKWQLARVLAGWFPLLQWFL